jgi:hypothetical protein
MDGILSFDWLFRMLRRPKRKNALQQAAAWPLITARVHKATVVPKDLLADEGSSFQTSQLEVSFFFTQDGSYHGGHLRSVPVSDSQGHRFVGQVKEDTLVQVRYDPHNPDHNHTLAADNPNTLPFAIWDS